MSTLNFNVNGDPRGDQPSLEPFDGNVPLQSHFEGGNPPNRFVATVPSTVSGGARLLYQNRTKEIRVILPPGDGSWEASDPPCRPPEQPDPSAMALRYGPPPSAKLTISGRDFLQNGARWLWKGSSDFRMYQWWLEGRDTKTIRQQRKAAGANLLRVVGMYNGGIGRFIPSDYPGYFPEWQPFLAACAEDGFQVEVTAFADAQNIMGTDEQQHHWGMLGSVLYAVPNVLVELVNEYPQNGVDPSRFSPLPNLLCSRGSALADAPPYVPGWQYHTWHGRRDWPKVLFSAEDMWYVGDGYGPAGAGQYPVIPVVHDEPIGFADQNQPGRRSNDPYVARVLGQSGAAFGAGSTFHSDYGIQSQIWSPTIDNLARVFFGSY